MEAAVRESLVSVTSVRTFWRFSAAVRRCKSEKERTTIKVIDYLAQEIKREETGKARKAKHERTAKLVDSLKAKAAGAGR